MRRKVLFILCSIFITSGIAYSQTKTITNADLEKYRQKRLAAERDYEENYYKKGFPSPEELERQNEESGQDLIEYSERLRAERVEEDNSFQAEADSLRSQIASVDAQINYLRGELNRNPNLGRIFLGGVGTSGGSGFQTGTRINRQILPNVVGSQRVLPNIIGTNNRSFGTLGNRAAYNQNSGVIVRGRISNSNGGAVFRGGIRGGKVFGGNSYGRRYNRRGGRFFGGNTIAYPYNLNSGYYQREQIVTNLRSLEQTKAGLLAQFSVLQAQANRENVRIN